MLLEKTKFVGPKSYIVGPELIIEDHKEISETNSKSKLLVLARYVRRNHAPRKSLEINQLVQ